MVDRVIIFLTCSLITIQNLVVSHTVKRYWCTYVPYILVMRLRELRGIADRLETEREGLNFSGGST